MMLNYSTPDRKAEDNRREDKKEVKMQRKEVKEIEAFMRKVG